MSGDWIKMRGNLWDDPRVAGIVDATNTSEATVIGAMYWLWASADQHSSNGVMPGLTLKAIDRKTGIPGFASAMCEIGWLADHPEGVRIVRFEEHNGSSAKKRCQTAKRVAKHSAANAELTHQALAKDDEALARDRDRDREEKIKDIVGGVKRRTQLRADFYPDETGVSAIEKTGLSLAVELGKFGDHHRAKGSVMLDWQAAWRTWVSNARRFAPPVTRQTHQAKTISDLTGGLASVKEPQHAALAIAR